MTSEIALPPQKTSVPSRLTRFAQAHDCLTPHLEVQAGSKTYVHYVCRLGVGPLPQYYVCKTWRDTLRTRARNPTPSSSQVLSESRLTAWQSDDGLPFAYSGKVMEPAPFSPNVLRLRDALYERTGVLYDGVLLNLYESRYRCVLLV